MKRALTILPFVLVLLTGTSLHAEKWYESYDKALDAIDKRQWGDAIRHLNRALDDKSGPRANAKTYGLRFIDYLPYLYRGLAHYHLGNDAAAREDLERSERNGAVHKASRDQNAARKLRELRELLAERERKRLVAETPTPEQDTQTAPPETNVAAANDNPPTLAGDIATTSTADASKSVPEGDATEVVPDRQGVTESGQTPDLVRPNQANREAQRKAEAGSNDLDKKEDDFREALARYNAGHFGEARALFMKLRQEDGDKYNADEYLAKIGEVEILIRNGITAYFEGEHDRSIKQLTAALRKNIANADVYAYLGCAYAAKYLLEGADDEELRRKAVEQFVLATQLQPEYQLDRRYISPTIVDLFTKSN